MNLMKDSNGKFIPQYMNEAGTGFEALKGRDGASFVQLTGSNVEQDGTIKTSVKGSNVESAFDIVPNNLIDLTHPTTHIYVGGAGNIRVELVNGGMVTLKGLTVGMHNISAKRVYATGTTATNLVGAYIIDAPFRTDVPKNFTKSQGELIEDFETGWTVQSGTGTIEDNLVDYKTGSKSLKINAPVGAQQTATKTISLNLSNPKMFLFWVYLHSEPSTVSGIVIYLSSTTSFSKYFGATASGEGLVKGWNLISLGSNSFGDTGGESWSNTFIRMRVRVDSMPGKQAILSVDSFYKNAESVPSVVIMFDDGAPEVHSEAFAYMEPKGIKGTVYAIPSLIDGTAMTSQQLDELYNAGWAVANHTYDHVNLSTLGTEEEVKAQIKRCTDWILSKGYSRAADHLAYPYGGYNDTVLTAARNLGLKTARTILAPFYTVAPVTDMHRLSLARNIINTTTVAQVKTTIDAAINNGGTAFILLHYLNNSPASATEWLIANFKEMIDYIDSTGVRCLTIDQWYDGLDL